jgi:hypothetical protein
MSIETKLRDAQASFLQTLEQSLTALRTSDWKGLQDHLLSLASARSESAALLLLLDFVATRANGSVDSAFGKLLVGFSGYNLIAFALQDKPAEVWSKVLGIAAQGQVETLGKFALSVLGATGAVSLLSAWGGPGFHQLPILSAGAVKVLFGYFLVTSATSDAKLGAASTELGRYHARTGLLLIVYALMLAWRSQSKNNAPKYIQDMEKRLNDKLDQLVVVIKDQKSRLDAISPATATPKKY